ncbi:MAG: arylsulfotransferase family protein [Solirubrobacteraceae bacterium]
MPATNKLKRRLAHRALALLGLAVAVGTITSLAFATKPTVARNAIYRIPKSPQCVPTQLDRSAVLPGTHLAVSPLPDSRDASYKTQISLLGYPASALSDIAVSGSASGAHSGRLEAYSQGDGASFVLSNPFHQGETVTVHGKLAGNGKTRTFEFHFTTAVLDVLPRPHATPNPAAKANELFTFHSRPELHVPRVTVGINSPTQTPGDIFAAPYSGVGQDGPMIFESSGNLVWFDPLPANTEATDLQVQSYAGKPVLTWWQGYIPPQGFGEGEEVIADSSYRQIMKFPAGNGLPADLHEFRITPQGTALLTSFDPIRCNLSRVGGSHEAAVTNSVFQEIDLKTHLVRREWTPLDHVALTQSYSSPKTSTTGWPFDYFHLNSVDPQQNGLILISSRNTSALYELNPSTGQVTDQIGGKRSTIKLGAGTATAYQHDATELPNGNIGIFDNGGVPMVHPQSRGIVVSIDPKTKTETLVSRYEHSQPLSAGSQGNVQALQDGDLFIGWGAEPYLTEYTPSGTVLYDARLPTKTESYRAFRFQWTGTPTGTPAIVASAGAKATTVYASWNGATEIASWRVLAGSSASSLTAATSTPRIGFETQISVPDTPAYVAVQALDAEGNVLGTSPAIKG